MRDNVLFVDTGEEVGPGTVSEYLNVFTTVGFFFQGYWRWKGVVWVVWNKKKNHVRIKLWFDISLIIKKLTLRKSFSDILAMSQDIFEGAHQFLRTGLKTRWGPTLILVTI